MSETTLTDLSGAVRFRGTIAPSGSGPFEIVGPYHVEFADLVHPLDTVTLFTPTAGKIVTAAFVNPRTFVAWTSTDSISIAVGHPSEVTFANPGDPPDSAWLRWDSDLIFDNHELGSGNGAILYLPAIVPAYRIDVAAMFTLAEDVKVLNGSIADLTAGEADIYFVIGTATAP